MVRIPYIDRVGLEVEGGWVGATVRPQLHRDGSLNGLQCPYGEAISRPIKRLDYLRKWIDKNWPTEVNSTCGYHIHVSLKSTGDYSRLMDKEFHDFVIARLTTWGKEWGCKNKEFWSRLEGHNSYCKAQWQADAQTRVRGKDSVRYAMLNFCYLHKGTVELRVLPAFKNKLTAISATECYLTGIGEYLRANTAPKVLGVGVVEVDVDETVSPTEDIETCV